MTKTILDFFKKTPNQNKGVQQASTSSSNNIADVVVKPQKETKKENEKSIKKNRSSNESSGKENVDDPTLDEPIRVPQKRPASSSKEHPQKKRRRLVVESDSDAEESDYAPAEESSESSSEPSGESSDESDSPPKRTKAKPKVVRTSTSTPSRSNKVGNSAPSTPATPSSDRRISDVTKCKLSSFSAANDDLGGLGDLNDTSRTGAEAGGERGIFDHLTFKFLQPDTIKDAMRRRPDHPDYDPRTVHVPDTFKNEQTPAMRQWWDIKTGHYDTILFFKVGKFYELYHMDAVVAVTELGLVYMRGSYAHSGFPEIAYSRMANQLVEKGYKVARVEQTETNDTMTERTRGRPVKERVVRREICRITTPGTRTANVTEGGVLSAGKDGFLLALKEMMLDRGASVQNSESDSRHIREFGVAFVDTSVGKIRIGQFSDDRQCSRLRTLFAHFPPSQILHERGNLKPTTLHILNTCLASVLKEPLVAKKEFWDSDKTLAHLAEAPYFVDEKTKKTEWPDALAVMLAEDDSLGRTAKQSWSLGVSALGGIVYYLGHCLMEDVVLSMRLLEIYRPPDLQIHDQDTTKPKFFYDLQTHMVLDGITLTNLDILVNSTSGTLEGTLLDRLDLCATHFGKRLLRQWITAPLCRPSSICARLDAVEVLMKAKGPVDSIREKLRKLPDLEKLIAKIHLMGCRRPDIDHPDNRAVLYEEMTYSRRKIEDFVLTLQGFEAVARLAEVCAEQNFKSPLLKEILLPQSENGQFPDLKGPLKFFKKAFDHDKAKKDGRIIPEKGVDEDYDAAIETIKETQDEAENYLREQSRELGCKISYFGSARNRFQLEIPESAVKRIPRSYELSSQKKGFKRYKTKNTERFLAEVMAAEEKKDAALRDVMRRLFAVFDKHYVDWQRAVRCLAELDCLIAMAEFSRSADGEMCRPEIVASSDREKPFLEIREGRHPCLTQTYLGGDYIPNDVLIGVSEEEEEAASLVLVTGPNMGGKSTLMRQTALLVILAQMGCYVPATQCRLSPVDRVFTRLGASDRIMSGESTFFVELSETASILQHASRHSLVLLDELGRGTATYDGTAIACAVVRELASAPRLQCRCLFSTHYHGLVEEFAGQPAVRLGHMACMVENEDAEDPTQETITFLYKFTPGACPKSYGFNAARLANLPEQIIQAGRVKAREFEEETLMLRFIRDVVLDKMTLDSAMKWQKQLENISL